MKKLMILAYSALIMLAGCDVERFPHDKYSADRIQSDKEAAMEILLNGCYAKLKDSFDQFHRTGEYPSDNICKDKPTTDPMGTYITYQHNANNAKLSATWNNAYSIISQSSSLMTMIQEGESEETDQKLGESYYMRGLMYFYLCRTFGRPYYQDPDKNLGVPIVNGLPDDMTNLVLPDRSSVKDTYEQAIADLKKGEALMNKYTSAAYASKYAAQAMLAKVYMYMSGTFDNPNREYAQLSFQYADEVIKNGPFELLSRDNFMRYNEYAPDDKAQTETIFAVKFINSDVATSYSSQIGSMYATINEVGWGEIYASKTLLDKYYEVGKDKDARSNFIRPDYRLENEEKIRAFRFVTNVYNSAGTQTGYAYKQGRAIVGANDILTGVNFGTESEPDIYPLTLVDQENKYYSIEYGEGSNKKTYIGDDDYYMNESQGHPKFFIYKCSLQEGYSHLYSPTVSRLGEIYLIRAEANAKLGKYAEALSDLNTIRERSIPGAGYTSLDASNMQELIMKERQLELAFEADRGFDVYRVGETMKRAYPGYHDGMAEYPATSTLVMQLIPQSEINAYPGTLTQNPL